MSGKLRFAASTGYESLVMNFGLSNAPPAFQHFMNDIFRDYIDTFMLVYVDDILIFSNSIEKHEIHVKKVLSRLRDNNLYAKLEKYTFDQTQVEFCGYVISTSGVQMDPIKVAAVNLWPVPRTVKQVESFLGFANFNRDFIENYSEIAAPLTALTRKTTPFVWTKEADEAFTRLKFMFTTEPVLRHPDQEKEFIVECNASDYAMAAILSQHFEDGLHPVAYFSRKFDTAELNYDVHDKELLAIVAALTEWRYLLEGTPLCVTVISDHKNLVHWQTSCNLNHRQVRWAQTLAAYDFTIVHHKGKLCGKPDALSRRPDFRHDTKPSPAALLPTNLFSEHSVAAVTSSKFTDTRLIVPEGLQLSIMQSHHDSPVAGHLGIEKTFELISRNFFWPSMRKDITDFVSTCDTCSRSKSQRHAPYGKLEPLPVPSRPWHSISFDFITDLPVSNGFDSILTVVCRLSKMAHFIACNKTTDAPELAALFRHNVVRLHGFPDNIVSD